MLRHSAFRAVCRQTVSYFAVNTEFPPTALNLEANQGGPPTNSRHSYFCVVCEIWICVFPFLSISVMEMTS